MSLPQPRAVIFDWDDTVVDNWHTSLQALNAALQHMGHAPWSDEEARRRAMFSAKDLFTQLFGPDKWQEADKVFFETYTRLVLGNIRIHDDIEDILKTLQANNVFLSVVSNKRGAQLRKEVEHIRFSPYFKSIVGAGDAVADKPDAAPVRLALRDSGIAPGADVWFVGDSQTDMLCAINAGCTPVLIETKLPPEDLLAKHPPAMRFRHYADMIRFLDGYYSTSKL